MDDQQSLLLLLLVVVVVVFVSLCLLWRTKQHYNDQTKAVLVSYPVIGVLPQFLKHRGRFYDWMSEVLAAAPANTVAFRRLGNLRGVITANPANVEHMLRTNFENYPKGARFKAHLRDFLGAGIFNSDGHLWKAQRKTASFEFTTRSLRSHVVRSVQHETAARLLPLLRKAAAAGELVDLQDLLERYAFDNVCKVAFGEDPACLQEAAGDALLPEFAAAFRDAADLSAGRFRYAVPYFWRIEKMLGVGPERRLEESIAVVHGFATRIIRSRLLEETTTHADDLLSRFIARREYPEELLRDIVISFLLAGRETTSSALSWFFWLVSSRPDVERKILEEITSVRRRRAKLNYETSRSKQSLSKDKFDKALGSDNPSLLRTMQEVGIADDLSGPTYKDQGTTKISSGLNNPILRANPAFELEELREMEYLHAAITESMRLYPPVPINTTTCQADEVLPDGTEIKKGWFMSYLSYAMGRMESIWGEDCQEYRPERWLDDGGTFVPVSPFKFTAFHGGLRMCLGKEMAYIQMKSAAACVLERFTVDVVDGKKRPEQVVSLTLRMKGGLPVRVRAR